MPTRATCQESCTCLQEESRTTFASPLHQQQTSHCANFSDLFDQSPGGPSKATPSKKSITFGLQGAGHDENTAPNISPLKPLHGTTNIALDLVTFQWQAEPEDSIAHTDADSEGAVLQAQSKEVAPSELKHGSARRRRRGVWATPTPAPEMQPASRRYASDDAHPSACTAGDKVLKRTTNSTNK